MPAKRRGPQTSPGAATAVVATTPAAGSRAVGVDQPPAKTARRGSTVAAVGAVSDAPVLSATAAITRKASGGVIAVPPLAGPAAVLRVVATPAPSASSSSSSASASTSTTTSSSSSSSSSGAAAAASSETQVSAQVLPPGFHSSLTRMRVAAHFLDVLGAPPREQWGGRGGAVAATKRELRLECDSRTVRRVFQELTRAASRGEVWDEAAPRRQRSHGGHNRVIADNSGEEAVIADCMRRGIGVTATAQAVNRWRATERPGAAPVGRSAVYSAFLRMQKRNAATGGGGGGGGARGSGGAGPINQAPAVATPAAMTGRVASAGSAAAPTRYPVAAPAAAAAARAPAPAAPAASAR